MKDITTHTSGLMAMLSTVLAATIFSVSGLAQDKFPDGTAIPEWFNDVQPVVLQDLGRQFVLTDYGVVNDSTLVQTRQIQTVIDTAAALGGGVVVIPEGTFMSGALFFKPKVHLYIHEGGVLKGSSDVSDFPVRDTRIEGQVCKYIPALINVDKCSHFRMGGDGTVNGNGLTYWKHFWQRREWNPDCTNKDEMRPRILFVSNSSDIVISGLHLKDSPFWTTHYYKCDHVKLIDLTITSPSKPVGAPSSDACDIDVCTDFLVHGCYMAVNDDAVVLKGGRGPYADKAPENGANERIIVEDCEYGFCHGGLTCGSESIHDRNIIIRRCKSNGLASILWFKMRVDTPQLYEYITMEDVSGTADNFIYVLLWDQFADLQGRKTVPFSYAKDVTVQRCKVECDNFIGIPKVDDNQFQLGKFTFRELDIKAKDANLHYDRFNAVSYENCSIETNGQEG